MEEEDSLPDDGSTWALFFLLLYSKRFFSLWLIFSLILHLNDGCQDWKKEEEEKKELRASFSLLWVDQQGDSGAGPSNWIARCSWLLLLARLYTVLFSRWRKLVCGSSCCCWMLSMTSSSSLGHFVCAERIGSFPVDCVLLLWTRCRAASTSPARFSLSP